MTEITVDRTARYISLSAASIVLIAGPVIFYRVPTTADFVAKTELLGMEQELQSVTRQMKVRLERTEEYVHTLDDANSELFERGDHMQELIGNLEAEQRFSQERIEGIRPIIDDITDRLLAMMYDRELMQNQYETMFQAVQSMRNPEPFAHMASAEYQGEVLRAIDAISSDGSLTAFGAEINDRLAMIGTATSSLDGFEQLVTLANALADTGRTSKVTFHTEKSGATVRYRFVGRRHIDVARGLTNESSAEIPIGYYYFWTERQGERTSKRDILRRIVWPEEGPVEIEEDSSD